MWFSRKKAMAAAEEQVNEMVQQIAETDRMMQGFNDKLDKILEQQNSMMQDIDALKDCLILQTDKLQEMTEYVYSK